MTELPCLSNAPTARQIEPPFCWQQAVRVSAAWLYAVGTWHCEYLKLLRNHLQYFDFIIFFCHMQKKNPPDSKVRSDFIHSAYLVLVKECTADNLQL